MLRLKSRFAEDPTELAQIRVVRKVRAALGNPFDWAGTTLKPA
jgi:hypothetical protein